MLQTPLLSSKAVPERSVQHRSVLCVGGRPRGAPIYRAGIEQPGARLLPHGVGSEEKLGQLGVMLQAADLVVCRVGCASHGACWRATDHCKRQE